MKAIIDLGTNTFHLLIAEITNGEIIEHKKLQIPVKIGEGGINKKQIAPAAFERGMDALKMFRSTLDDFKIKDVKAFGTSAIRDAENGQEFIDKAKDLYRINIKVISGQREAELIYNGVKHSFELPDENVLMMDIGGGSVEFIIAYQEKLLAKHSFQLGAARLIETFHKHDPITDEEIIVLRNHLVSELRSLSASLKKFPAHTLIGSAGSFETLVEVLQKDLMISTIPLCKHADEISLHSFAQFYETITKRDIEQRATLHGMADFRVEMIVAATILMDVVIKQYEITRLIASHYSLKEGMLLTD